MGSASLPQGEGGRYRAGYGVSSTNELPKGSSLRFGGVNPVTTITWIGGHLSLIAAASGGPIHELGMLISVIES